MPDGLALGFTLVPPNELAGPLGLVLYQTLFYVIEVPALKHLKHITFLRGWIFVVETWRESATEPKISKHFGR